MKILVADDDHITREGLSRIFRREGYRVVLAANGEEALALFAQEKPDLVCLDIMMPGTDGFQVCQKIRDEDELIPILFISAKGEEIDKVLGMDLGADDFIVKPFGVREVVARIRAVTRRCLAARNVVRKDEELKEGNSSFAFGDLQVFAQELRAKRGNQVIDLSLREVKILELFSRHPGKVLNRVFIAKECWGFEVIPTSRTIDQHISLLRKKIEGRPESVSIIQTIYGVGYRYEKGKEG